MPPRRRFYIASLAAALLFAAAQYLVLEKQLPVEALALVVATIPPLMFWILAGHAQAAGGFRRISLPRYLVLVGGIFSAFAAACIGGAILLLISGLVTPRSVAPVI